MLPQVLSGIFFWGGEVTTLVAIKYSWRALINWLADTVLNSTLRLDRSSALFLLDYSHVTYSVSA